MSKKPEPITLEDLLRNESDAQLLCVWHELETKVCPATGYAHEYCRKVNRMIDKGTMCINPLNYRKVYLPTLAKFVMREMAARYVAYCYNGKGPDGGIDNGNKEV